MHIHPRLTLHIQIYLPSSFGSNWRAAELMQKRWPVVSRGPSSKTWPRWAPQFLQMTSVRLMKNERSSCSSTFCRIDGPVKAGPAAA